MIFPTPVHATPAFRLYTYPRYRFGLGIKAGISDAVRSLLPTVLVQPRVMEAENCTALYCTSGTCGTIKARGSGLDTGEFFLDEHASYH